ncbi:MULTISPECIES: IS1634 family transposase [Rhodococcus]|nr:MULTISPECIES: IS1634 family transposase [Rhodococcus]MBC2589861.1 IS1634 family transposase [Rhodococcus aetherivorans]MBC2591069.1 IS1634 family transposase [Rhodococcus aetherivorans]OLL18365.1 IS1634 family transposase [Rhodococcus sp. M8]OLL20090.1 IS1634 family transposase [Rhodococcus sp. M8]QPG43486.1 IS1634 family transposase [Rhodococcus sp. M8]
MAFVRKVRTKSGATAVQIARYVGGRQEIVKHIGSAHTDVELGMLLERARAWLEPDQQVLDLGVTPQVPVEKPLAGGQSALFDPAQRTSQVDAPGRTESTGSVLLRQVLTDVYDQLGFGIVDDAVFRDLVIARIVEPGSKLDAGRVLKDLGADPPSYATIKRHLGQINTGRYRDRIAEQCFEYAAETGGLSLLLYDVTTLYFEAEKEDDLRKVGYSKERRVDPQIVVGLLVDRTGFPLEIGCYEGNSAETRTIVPIVRQFQARHDLDGVEMVVAADAGMLSAANLAALDEAGLKFIVGSRTTKAPGDLASHFHWNGNVFTDGQIIDTITPRHGRSVVNNPRRRAEPIWNATAHPNAWRAIWQYSRSRAGRDEKTLNAQEARARAVVDGDTVPKSTRFVTVTAKGRRLDTASLERARMLVGLKGYVTNLPAPLMDPREIIAKYHELWHVEQSFRMSKTDLRARPIFHRTRDAIEAHLTVVFAALAVSRVVQERSGLAIGKVVKLLRPLRSATIAINGTRHTFPPQVDADLQALLDRISGSGLTH